MEFSGDFETHLTVDALTSHEVEALARWAREHDLKFTHIALDRGEHPSQPMVTYHDHGTLTGQREIAEQWAERLAGAGFTVVRVKIETSLRGSGVPETREEALALPAHCYFEFHLKVRLDPTEVDLGAITHAVLPHRARLSRNARRKASDGVEERFVTQRCAGVGADTALRLRGDLLKALADLGLPYRSPFIRDARGTIEIESEFVVHDSALDLDAGWLDHAFVPAEEVPPPEDPEDDPYTSHRHPLLGSEDRYPNTHLPNTAGRRAAQAPAFDPALKHVQYAYRPGDPTFTDPALARHWWRAQEHAMERALAAVASTGWRDRLVLRGSMLMPFWAGTAARRPRDLDFVTTPPGMEAFGEEAATMFDEITAAFDRELFDVDDARVEGIWTYERVPGRRLMVPWRAEGIPPGTVQIDVVFDQPLPEPPLRIDLDGTEVLAVGPELSLAWKVLWFCSDFYPQGKDLYDAVLLAENCDPTPDFLDRVIEGGEAEQADEVRLRVSQGSVGEAIRDEWHHFAAEHPWVEGDADHWIARFDAAMAGRFPRL